MVYKFLRLFIGLGIRLYYKEVRVRNKKELQKKGAKIIIANHPNTLMDAWMIGFLNREPVYYMAKATLFNSPFKKWFLRHLGLIPINRAKESKTSGVSNQTSFSACYELLEKGGTLVIFPEGTSYREHQLRVLKSGAARIALEVLKRNKGNIALSVIPIGLVYVEPEKFRSSVLISVGASIVPTEFLEKYNENTSRAAKELTELFRERMSALLVGANSNEHEQLVDEIRIILSSDYTRNESKGVEKDVKMLKQIFEKINEIQLTTPDAISEIKELVYRIKWRMEKLDIKSDFLDRSYRPRMFFRQIIFSIIFLIVGLPIFLIGMIHNAIQYYLIDFLVGKLVKEMEYYAAVAILFSLIFYPCVYIFFIYLVDAFFPLTFFWWLSYLILMPMTGLFAWFFYHYVKHISFKTNYILLMSTQRGEIEALKDDRELLKKLILSD